ncbi:MAG: SRPBCC domain-containing protein [Phycisphaeraceae bacterium]|nr:SRPBCC domain-containing protein [Phycisphaeraceae bacterium]MCW5755078.1 SRPBCC domain-containing protein [Phycisphaeraceae bacterium]
MDVRKPASGGHNIVVTRVIAAPRELVWLAWTDPLQTAKWFCPRECAVTEYHADVRLGGGYRVEMVCNGSSHRAFGTYLEIRPVERLVFTHQWHEPDAPETVVEVEFTEVSGCTRITLRQSGLGSDSSAKGHESGWASAIEHLAASLGSECSAG